VVAGAASAPPKMEVASLESHGEDAGAEEPNYRGVQMTVDGTKYIIMFNAREPVGGGVVITPRDGESRAIPLPTTVVPQ